MTKFTIAGKELDFYDDIDSSYAKENMEKIGHLDVTGKHELSSLSDDDFALKVITKLGHGVRKYPIASPGDVIISTLYFEKNASKLPDKAREIAATFLKKAAATHGIPTPEIVEKYASDELNNDFFENGDTTITSEDTPVGADDWALTTPSGKMYPLNTSENTKTAMRYFEELHRQIDEPSYRKEMATNITKKAAEFGIEIDEDSAINHYAAGEYSPLLGSRLEDRRGILQNDEYNLGVFESLVEKKASLSPVEFADALHTFDKKSGISRYWDGGHLTDAYKSTFQRVKTASRTTSHKGTNISEGQLDALCSSEKIASTFDGDFVSEFKKAPLDVFNSLPDPEKDLIASLINESR